MVREPPRKRIGGESRWGSSPHSSVKNKTMMTFLTVFFVGATFGVSVCAAILLYAFRKAGVTKENVNKALFR